MTSFKKCGFYNLLKLFFSFCILAFLRSLVVLWLLPASAISSSPEPAVTIVVYIPYSAVVGQIQAELTCLRSWLWTWICHPIHHIPRFIYSRWPDGSYRQPPSTVEGSRPQSWWSLSYRPLLVSSVPQEPRGWYPLTRALRPGLQLHLLVCMSFSLLVHGDVYLVFTSYCYLLFLCFVHYSMFLEVKTAPHDQKYPLNVWFWVFCRLLASF